MTVVHTRQGRTLFVHGEGRRPSISFAMDSRGKELNLKRLTFDETADLIDSSFARNCIDALRAKLDPKEMDRILRVLVDADLITKEEASAVGDDIDVETNAPRETEAAFDERFPDAKRLKYSSSYTPGSVPLRSYPQMTAAQEQEFAQRFPDAGRLKA